MNRLKQGILLSLIISVTVFVVCMYFGIKTDSDEVIESTKQTTLTTEEETTVALITVKETEISTTNKWSEDEINLLARLIYAESGIESYQTQLKVGSVVLNRINSDEEFPDDIYSVVYESGQFSVVSDGTINQSPSDTSIQAAKYLVSNGSVLPENVLYFYEKSVTNNWVNTRAVYGVYDHTVFAYDYAG